MVFPSSHCAFEAKEPGVEHLSTLEVKEKYENWQPLLCFWYKMEPFRVDYVLLDYLLLVIDDKDDISTNETKESTNA